MPSDPDLHDLAERLLTWYDAHRRTMPWREDPTPYHVLLSELMLQQTRVDTVVPYFERFVQRWPTLADFAAAQEEEVMQMWAGLGYYRRARNLLKAARLAVQQGGLTGEVEALRALPGIGPYTAGAIASIAFGTRTPVVDGNVERVLSRMYRDPSDPTTTRGKRAFWQRADPMVPAERPGDFNQALMELGATVCTPRTPDCPACPWSGACQAHRAGDALEFPKKKPKKKPTPVRGVAGILHLDGGVLLARRPPGVLLGGLWEPPSLLIDPDADLRASVVRAFKRGLDLDVRVDRRLGDVKHVFTHRRLTRTVFRVELVGVGEPSVVRAQGDYDDVRVLRPGQELALSRLARKTLALAQDLPLLG